MEYNGDWLYKRAASGKIQTWRIKASNTGHIVTEYGQYEGKAQQLLKQVTEGKQKRSISEQACFEAKADEKSKKDEGYKSLNELGITDLICGHGDPILCLEEKLLEKLPKHNTNAQGYTKVMLSQPIQRTSKGVVKTNWDKIIFPCIGEYKLDGVRANFLTKTKQEVPEALFNSSVTSLSREAMSYDFATGRLREKLEGVFEAFPNVILDGELYKHEMPQGKISGAMRSKGGGDNLAVFKEMQFHIYDIIDTELTLIQRKDLLFEMSALFLEDIVLHPYTILNNMEELEEFENEAVDLGYEGIMVKNTHSMYKPDVRSYDSLKIKRFQDAEYVITGYELGSRGVRDLVFTLKHPEGRADFKSTAIGSVADKQALLDRFPELIGKKATIKFKDFTEYGTPNHGHVKDIRDYEG